MMPFETAELRRMRLAAKLTLVELAERLGSDHGTLSKMERGVIRTNAPLVAEWAEHCGFRLRFIAKDADEEERMLGHLDSVDRVIVARLAAVLPDLASHHRASLLHFLDLWERPEAREVDE